MHYFEHYFTFSNYTNVIQKIKLNEKKRSILFNPLMAIKLKHNLKNKFNKLHLKHIAEETL